MDNDREFQGSLRIAGVSERDIDLLLLEEFTSTESFARWFMTTAGLRVDPAARVTQAQRSVTQSIGESDLLIEVADPTGIHFLLVENKVSAGFQPRQAARYHERGEESRTKGHCITFSTVLVAPSEYLGTSEGTHGFDAVVRYEQLLSWYSEQHSLGTRAAYKQALIASAINKSKLGYQPIEDAPVTDFWRSYWLMAISVAPELEMPEPTGKPSRAGFVRFRPQALPDGIVIVHKLRHGFLDLQFRGLGNELSRLRARFGSLLLPGMTIERASESGVIRQRVHPFDAGRAFSDQSAEARSCLEQAVALLYWYEQVAAESSATSEPVDVQRFIQNSP